MFLLFVPFALEPRTDLWRRSHPATGTASINVVVALNLTGSLEKLFVLFPPDNQDNGPS